MGDLREDDISFRNLCEDNPDCYYKKLKRKEQECEKLINQGDKFELENKILKYERDRYKQALDEIGEYFKVKNTRKTSLFNIFVIEQEIFNIINKVVEHKVEEHN